ncbi:MAG TPA: SH3 domain-containing protein [Phototrophicaceae bacterium]|nr:SH3 domain-containing protein [Phototrophicaceae bacterium]
MARIRPLIVALMLLLLPLIGVQGQGQPPSQIALAISNLSSLLGQPITINSLDNWSYAQNFYTDSALGCPYVMGTPVPSGISAYTFKLTYKGVTYDYRVSADGSLIFPCLKEGGGPLGATAQPLQPGQATAQPSNCPAGYAGYLAPRLQVGAQAQIATNGTPNRLRNQPSVNAQQIGMIQPGTTVSVVGGPTCEDSSKIVWWQVIASGVTGWTAEGQLPNNYFLAPVGGSLQAERDLITVSNVGSLVPLSNIPLAGVSSIAFSQDNQWIALGGLSGLAVYDLSTLKLLPQLGDISQPVTAVAFSNDGRYLTAARQDGSLQIEDTGSGTRVLLGRSTNERINSVTFSPDARDLLAFGSGTPTGTTAAWEIFNLPGNSTLRAASSSTPVRGVAFSSDGTLFAWVDAALNVMLTASSTTVRTTALTQATRGGVAWRPSSHAVAFADGTNIRLDNLDNNTEQVYTADANFIPAVMSFSKDGSLLATMDVPSNTATGSNLNIFDTDTADLITNTVLEASNTLVFSPDGTLLAIGANDQVILLGANTSGDNAVG